MENYNRMEKNKYLIQKKRRIVKESPYMSFEIWNYLGFVKCILLTRWNWGLDAPNTDLTYFFTLHATSKIPDLGA